MDLRNSGMLESYTAEKVAPSMPRPLKYFYKGEPMALGITQILIGILQIAFGLMLDLATETHEFNYLSFKTPLWTGILCIISGSLSVAAAKNPRIQLVKGALGMNIVTAVIVGFAVVIFSTLLNFFQPPMGKRYTRCEYNNNTTVAIQACHEAITVPYAMRYTTVCVLLMLAAVGFFIAIVNAALSCASLCRDTYSETTIIIFQKSDVTSPPLPVPESLLPN